MVTFKLLLLYFPLPGNLQSLFPLFLWNLWELQLQLHLYRHRPLHHCCLLPQPHPLSRLSCSIGRPIRSPSCCWPLGSRVVPTCYLLHHCSGHHCIWQRGHVFLEWCHHRNHTPSAALGHTAFRCFVLRGGVSPFPRKQQHHIGKLEVSGRAEWSCGSSMGHRDSSLQYRRARIRVSWTFPASESC